MNSSLHISIVLFRPRWSELEKTLGAIAACDSEFVRLHVLLSGANDDRAHLDTLLSAMALTDKSQVVHRYDNLGFASGHNLLLEQAFGDGADACLVLNPDVTIEAGALTHLVNSSTGFVKDSLVGPSLSNPAKERRVIDSLGIRWTASGRHVDDRQGDDWLIRDGSASTQEGITGACLLVGAGAYQTLTETTGHFFDDLFLAYREDAELGVRAKAVGVQSIVVEINGFSHLRHVQGFRRGHVLADLLGVRNRFLIRWKLGTLRPGAPILPSIRDGVVIAATFATERTSIPGLREAFRLRRTARGRRRRF